MRRELGVPDVHTRLTPIIAAISFSVVLLALIFARFDIIICIYVSVLETHVSRPQSGLRGVTLYGYPRAPPISATIVVLTA
jgi:hypothetical protein